MERETTKELESKLRSELEGIKSAHESDRAGWTTQEQLMEAGIRNKTDRRIALLLQEESGKPLGEWLESIQSAPPEQLSHLFRPTTTATTATTATTPRQPVGSSPSTTVASRPAKVTIEMIRAAGARARRRGASKEDVEAYESLKAQAVSEPE